MLIRTVVVGVLASTIASRTLMTQEDSTISRVERLAIASDVFHRVLTYFPDVDERQFTRDYRSYMSAILASGDDRRAFDLASMALLATLHDSHTWFYDDWLDRRSGQAIGLTVYRLGREWTVVRSRLPFVKVGTVIRAIDGVPVDEFFARERVYISASSERDATTSLFDTPALFPRRFTLLFADGSTATIDREQDEKAPDRETVEGRWLVPGALAYVRISAFQGIATVASAWRYVNEYQKAAAIVVDLRGNFGGGDPRALQAALMGKSYPMWSESASMSGGALLRAYGVSHPGMEHIRVSQADLVPRGTTYSGRLFLLIDRGCTCACEDFVMPFKVSERATLVGEATAGSFSFTSSAEFANGMRLNVAAVRHTFPDGSRFEGVGIVPNIEVSLTASDLRGARDAALERAVALAKR